MTTPEQHIKNARIYEEIFGKSLRAETDSDRHEAVRDWCRAREWRTNNDSVAWYWHQREGQSWQQDLEAHVAAWRKTPPDYCNSIDLCVNELQPRLEELELWVAYHRALTVAFCNSDSNESHDYLVKLPAEARVDAALQAWDASREKEGEA